MFKTGKLFFTIVLMILVINMITPTCYGNSAEPPSILIIVPNAPDDLEISIGPDNTDIKANKRDKIIEKYYTFYSHQLRTAKDYTIQINTRGNTFGVLLAEPLKTYNNVFTLNLDQQTLIPGKLLSRSILLVSLRMTLTILIEAIVFLLFGFKYKGSWIAFLIINLITQGALNIWLNGFGPFESYIILTLIFGEVFVFITEMIASLKFIYEHSPIRRVLYVVIANLLSLFVGGYIITILPI